VGEAKRKNEYLAVYEEWLRRGQPGCAPSAPRYGLTTSDVSSDLQALESRLVPAGMSSWRYYDPEYYQPLQVIRWVADLLGLDPDDAAAEWHEWSQKHWNSPEKLKELYSDYLHAEHEAQEDFSAYLFKNSRGYKHGQPYPRIPNPNRKTYASLLLAKHTGK
jgi:hypothetical protein